LNPEKIHSVYFVGIGGIGMSALARYFVAIGARVAGYDRTSTALTDVLVAEGMEVGFEDEPRAIPQWFLDTSLEKALVVYTPAIPAAHAGLAYLRNHGCKVMKRSEVLSAITDSYKTIAVAGTHGKTTTSAMTAHIFRHSDTPCNSFLGGISANYNTNVLLSIDAEWAVAEADEYDRSFLRLNPYIAIVTSVEADHLDIYGTEGELVKSFNEFAAKVHPDGVTIFRYGIDLKPSGTSISYAIDEPAADLIATDIQVTDGAFHFSVVLNSQPLGRLTSFFPGRHNVENCLAAVGAALQAGISWKAIAAAVETFKGVKRRFEYQIRRSDLVFIDDYAHHPTEISSCIGAVRELYPGKRITGVFQPHLFSRTRDFADDFASSLDELNELLLMEIYPAREEPIPGIDSTWLLGKVQAVNKQLVKREELVERVLDLSPEVLLTMGAGDIDKMIEPLKSALNE
jgi:UDP-N-acetylmuramate--alanine ligase